MKRPIEHEYNSFVSYARELEKYCDWQEAEIERLRARESGELKYAARLGKSIWRKRYAKKAPDWKPLPDLYGVLTQIDNMIAGLE
jgi:hypothetical protein